MVLSQGTSAQLKGNFNADSDISGDSVLTLGNSLGKALSCLWQCSCIQSHKEMEEIDWSSQTSTGLSASVADLTNVVSRQTGQTFNFHVIWQLTYILLIF